MSAKREPYYRPLSGKDFRAQFLHLMTDRDEANRPINKPIASALLALAKHLEATATEKPICEATCASGEPSSAYPEDLINALLGAVDIATGKAGGSWLGRARAVMILDSIRPYLKLPAFPRERKSDNRFMAVALGSVVQTVGYVSVCFILPASTTAAAKERSAPSRRGKCLAAAQLTAGSTHCTDHP